MPIIPKSLQQRRPQKPQSLAQYQASRLPVQQVAQQDTALQQRYEEAKKILEGVSFEDYESKYAKIPEELKQYFTSPEEVKSSKEYKEYQQQSQSYEQQRMEFEVIKTFLGQPLTEEVKSYLHENPKEYTRLQEIANEQYGGGRQEISSEVRNIEKLGLGGIKLGTSAIYKQQPKTTSVYMGGKEYKNVPTDVALRIVRGETSLLENYGYVSPKKSQEFREQAERLRQEQTYFGAIKKDVGKAVEFVKSYFTPEPEVTINLDKGTMEYTPRETETITNKNFGKPGEKYDPYSKTFYSISPTGEEGTLFIRPPTPAERILIEEQKKKDEQFKKDVGKAITTGVYDFLPERTRRNIGTFGLSVQEEIQKFGRKVTGEVLPELRQRYESEERISNFGNQLNLEAESLQREASTINQQDAAAVEEFNQRVDEFNKQLEEYEVLQEGYELSREEQEQNPLFNLGGIGYGMGSQEFGRNVIAGAIEFIPSTLSSAVGILTSPRETLGETVSGIIQLPGEIIKRPAATTGYITGQIFGAYITGKVSSGIKINIQGIKATRELKKSISYEKPDVTPTPFSTTFPREVNLDDFVFRTPARQQLSLKRFQAQQRLEAEAFRKKYPTIIQNKPVDLIITKLDDVTPATTIIQDGFKKTIIPKKSGGFRTITQIIPEEQGSTISQAVKSGRQQLIQVQKIEPKQIVIPKEKVMQRVNLISQTSPISLLWGLQGSSQSPFQKVKLSQKQLEKEKQVSSFIFLQQQPQLEKQMTKQKERQLFLLGQPQLERQDSRLKSLSLVGILSLQQQQQRQGLGYIQGLKQIPRQEPREVLKPEEKTPWGFRLKGEKEKPRKEQAYDGYILIDTKKGKGKWIKVTDKPATYQGALDRAAQKVDREISARGKVIRATRVIQGKKKFVEAESNALLQPNGYYQNNKYKFRQFKQKKGIRTAIPNQIIELQKYRLDSSGEVRKIQKERAISTRGMFGF